LYAIVDICLKVVRNVGDMIKFEFERCQTFNVFSIEKYCHIFVYIQWFWI